jgi:DNA replication and repair protein RecF
MAITHLRINNLRLIDQLEFEPTDGLNLIWGENGSGKTTILEAIYILGRGKSFRRSERDQLTRRGAGELSLFIRTQGSNYKHTLGLIKSGGATQAKLDGTRVTRMSDLARAVPLAVITPNSHEILERGPQYRRRFLDWGVFHVEQNFRNTFERFTRCLKQRNAVLRLRGGVDASWDREFVECGNAVNELREGYCEKLSERIKYLAEQLVGIDHLEIEWIKGWSDKHGLEQSLTEMRQGDIQAGYTRYGPQRADLSLKLNGQKVERVASRGQQKMLVAAMYLAQVELAKAISDTDTIILIDDLTSELDNNNRGRLLAYLNDMGNQTLITGVNRISRDTTGFSGMFHVEQGRISPG